jgi:hypothetical protein
MKLVKNFLLNITDKKFIHLNVNFAENKKNSEIGKRHFSGVSDVLNV